MRIVVLSLLALAGCTLLGQQSATTSDSESIARKSETAELKKSLLTRPTPEIPPGYVLGPGDQIVVHVMNVDEFNDKPIQVDLNGYVGLALAGRVRVAGLTIQQAESTITDSLKSYILHPDVSVYVSEFRGEPVSVIGSVKNPGIEQLQGRKTLLEVISLAGGLDSTTAGPRLKITRRMEWGPIPLPGAKVDATNEYSVAEVSIKSLLDAAHPEQNILVKPYDVISVPRAENIYVIGEVLKAGGFPVNSADQITVLQAISLAGGMDKMAKPQEARILRRVQGEPDRTELAVNVRQILDGKAADVPLQAEDILFIPNNIPKQAVIRAIEASIQVGTGLVIWRRP